MYVTADPTDLTGWADIIQEAIYSKLKVRRVSLKSLDSIIINKDVCADDSVKCKSTYTFDTLPGEVSRLINHII